MRFLYILWHALWIVHVVVEAILLAILVRRDVRRQFPIFFLYIAWDVALNSLLVLLDYSGLKYAGYYYHEVYRVDTTGDAILIFCVLYELFSHLVGDYPVLKNTGSSLYRQTVLFFLAVALVLAWYAPAYSPEMLIPNLAVLQRSARLLQCGLLTFLFMFAHSFGLSLKSRMLGIALGLGITATIGFVLAAIRVHLTAVLGPTFPKGIMELIHQMGDLAAVGIWMAYALAPESRRIDVFPTLPDDNLQGWNSALRRLLP
ncbi:MAG TPA: hypothetical protein VMB18_13340 [Terriglobales bacterium]|nr:hypothetical protein [Terriglobales bacterium]